MEASLRGGGHLAGWRLECPKTQSGVDAAATTGVNRIATQHHLAQN